MLRGAMVFVGLLLILVAAMPNLAQDYGQSSAMADRLE